MTAQTYELTGHSIIAGQPVVGTGGTTQGFNPATNQGLEPKYSLISKEQLGSATQAAEEAFDVFRQLVPAEHAAFLDRIADNIDAAADSIIERAMSETGLPETRLRGEVGRTSTQLRLFGTVVRAGQHHGVRVDPALPDRTPTPRVDIRQRKIPLGPVAVFGASNFPLAFSTAGGDTASALAAGCPVVFKAHNAHPGTGELVGQAITAAVKDSGLHPGTFSLLYGPGASVGQALVSDPVISAVGFTGSRNGGTALVKTASQRPVPIPVYAEMSSINPVYVLPGMLVDEIEALAKAYVGSVTGSSGQLCTQPGLVFVPNSADGDAFAQAVASEVSQQSGQTMLTSGICESWSSGVEALTSQVDVETLGLGTSGESENAPAPGVFQTSANTFRANPVLQDEIFGAASLIIRYESIDELIELSRDLEGQLTATLQITESDYDAAARLLPTLERKAGRVLVNGWPTGVEVGHAMVHGGPYPATSDSRTTSVGTLAVERFLRPVAYQNMPEELLPAPVREANPWQLTRLTDGIITKAGER